MKKDRKVMFRPKITRVLLEGGKPQYSKSISQAGEWLIKVCGTHSLFKGSNSVLPYFHLLHGRVEK